MLTKKIATLAVATALTMGGAVSAQAWTWAAGPSDSIKFTGGGGFGTLDFGAADVTLKPSLRDTVVGDGRVYGHVKIQNKSDSSIFAYISSGKRSDGESAYVYMGPTNRSLSNGSGTYKYTVDTCRSVTLNDPCSTDKRKLGF